MGRIQAKGQFRTQNPEQVDLPACNQTIANEGSRSRERTPRPLQVSWADAVPGGRARIEAAPPNANTQANKELAQIKQMLLQLTKDNAKLREDINVLKEENARLRNGGKDSKEVAQIAKDTEVGSVENERQRNAAVGVLRRQFSNNTGDFLQFAVCSACKEALTSGKVPVMSVSNGYRYPPKPSTSPR
ncbi:hypothetical protein HPB49_009428 [Dermacentor silvarum]|uniref:Uncharacterized protein n=1 Tax=Dermacentor silvarum TaxID=543639 RepID=A0ACB8DYL8_DERSI|nr:hypothetical protein HPB49_009428 [Dermacentor silvarum]